MVVGDRPQAQVGDAGDDGVEEEAVVRDQDDGARVLVQVLLEPVAGVEVEMVGRLVEQEQARPLQQQLGERDAHLPAAGEGLGRLVEVALLEPEAAQHCRHAQVHRVAVEPAEVLLALGVPHEHRFVCGLVQRGVGQLLFEDAQLLLERQLRPERLARLADERPPAVLEPVLREVADGEVGRRNHLAGVRLVQAREHREKRRLAGAVGAAQSDPVTSVQLPGHVVQEDAIGEGLA